MRVQVASEAGEKPYRLEVPWGPTQSGSCFYDLREQPAALEHIEPARRHLALRSFLTLVNGSDSIFATVKAQTALSQDAAVASGAYAFASRVALVFARAELNFQRENYEALLMHLRELLEKDTAPDTLDAEFHIPFCYFHAAARAGHALAFHLRARGTTPEQAELRWGLGLARVQQALLFLSRALRQKTSQSN